MKKSNKEIKEEIFALTVSSYSDYIDRPAVVLANIVASAPTLSDLVPQTGAKANTIVEMNILTTNVTYSNADCVASETGNNTVLAPRPTSIKRITDREEICLDVLDAKLPMLQKPGAYNTELTFASQYMDLKIAENAKQLEKLAWQGDTTIVGATNNLNKAKGWLKTADGETGALGYYDTVTSTDLTPANIIGTIQTLINNRTEEMYEMDNVKIWMSLPDAATLQQALLKEYGTFATGVFVNTGDQNQTGTMRFLFPGTNVEIIGTHGLNGNRSVFMTNHNNLRYLTDLESDKEEARMFFDQYHKKLVTEIIFAIGFNYEFPENVGYLKFALS